MVWFKKFRARTVEDLVAEELKASQAELLMAESSVDLAMHNLTVAQSRVAVLRQRCARLAKSQQPVVVSGRRFADIPDTVRGQLEGAL